MANLFTEIRYLIDQLQVISGFNLDVSLRVFSRDLKKALKVRDNLLNYFLFKLLSDRS